MADGVFRIVRDADHPYANIANALARDATLTWGARGIMLYLLSHNDNWQVRITDLVNASPGGKVQVQSLVKELETAGYIVRDKTRNESGRFIWTTSVFESPRTTTMFSSPGLPMNGGTVDGKPGCLRTLIKEHLSLSAQQPVLLAEEEDGLDVFAGTPMPEKKEPVKKEKKSRSWDTREPTETMRYFFSHKTPPRRVLVTTFQYDEWVRLELERGATIIYAAMQWALRNNVAVGQLLSAAAKWGKNDVTIGGGGYMAQGYVPDMPNPTKVHGGDGPIRSQTLAQLHANVVEWERSADNAKMRPDDVSHRVVKAYRQEIEKREKQNE